jgi:hypothetical protein
MWIMYDSQHGLQKGNIVNVETSAHNLSCNCVGGVRSVRCDKHRTLLFCKRFLKMYISKTSKVRFVSVRFENL